MRPAGVEGALSGRPDVGRRVEVGLTDLEVDDRTALGLEGAGPGGGLERGLRPDPRHPPGELHRRIVAEAGTGPCTRDWLMNLRRYNSSVTRFYGIDEA